MRALLFVVVALLVCHSAAISIKWTGYANNNQWATQNNWYPDQVPGSSDDVTIDSGNVLVTVPAAVNSLTMGDKVGAFANLTLFQAFNVGAGGLNCEQNGNLIISSGSSQITTTGTVTISGVLYFSAGQISGQWNIVASGQGFLNGGGEKTLSGATLGISGPTQFSGVIVLNQSSQITVTGTATGSGNWAIQAQDSTTVLFDASAGTVTYTGGGDFSVQAPLKLGTFNFQAGNMTIYDSMTFVNPFVIPNGSYVGTVGTAAVNMTAGVSGSGVLTAQGSSLELGSYNISGHLVLAAGNINTHTVKNGAYFAVNVHCTGATIILNQGMVAYNLFMQSGQIQGAGGITATNGQLNSQGFNANSAIKFTGAGTFSSVGTSLIAFNTGGSLSLGFGTILSVTGALSFTGAGTPGAFSNSGTVNVNGGFSIQNLNMNGNGLVNVAAPFSLNVMAFTQGTVALQGNGKFSGSTTSITSIGKVTAATSVHAVIGQYTFNCPKECDNISTQGTPTDAFTFTA